MHFHSSRHPSSPSNHWQLHFHPWGSSCRHIRGSRFLSSHPLSLDSPRHNIFKLESVPLSLNFVDWQRGKVPSTDESQIFVVEAPWDSENASAYENHGQMEERKHNCTTGTPKKWITNINYYNLTSLAWYSKCKGQYTRENIYLWWKNCMSKLCKDIFAKSITKSHGHEGWFMIIVGAFYFLELARKLGPSVIKWMAVCANSSWWYIVKWLHHFEGIRRTVVLCSALICLQTATVQLLDRSDKWKATLIVTYHWYFILQNIGLVAFLSQGQIIRKCKGCIFSNEHRARIWSWWLIRT